ncbi:MAG TPA: hypothetical protein VFO74_02300 [Pseudolabrys sp.]|jgi:hypothetical protein|nr:hypothetical protein [Pseudolabrys sp.]
MNNPTELYEQASWYLRGAKNASDTRLKRRMAIYASELIQLAAALSRATDDGAPETS